MSLAPRMEVEARRAGGPLVGGTSCGGGQSAGLLFHLMGELVRMGIYIYNIHVHKCIKCDIKNHHFKNQDK